MTGITAIGVDISDRLGNALLPFGLVVVGLSFILLTMVFRSLWVPIKATLGYLLSVGSSFGIVVLVFQDGWGASLLGLDRAGPIISFLPILLMGVLFGLAMDYEVFLVSRIREEYVHGGDARAAVQTGFVHSATVVAAAAAIMFSVFAAFVPEGDVNIKPIALGLAVGVFIDAFIVRMTLVPAVMQLLGDRAWHFPHRLDRLLPHFDVEGEGLVAELSLADWPEPGSDDAVVAQDLRLDGPDGPFYAGVAVRVPRGGTLVVSGPHRSGRTPLLLTLAGRVHADSGRLKVDGLVAPVRASAIRGRVAVARMARVGDPMGELRAALGSGAPIVAIDDLDAVTDPQHRSSAAARAGPRARRRHDADDHLPRPRGPRRPAPRPRARGAAPGARPHHGGVPMRLIRAERVRFPRRATWVTVVGLALVPLVIGGLLTWALWNPTQRLDRITAAVVNLDEPVTIDGQMVPLGRQLAGGPGDRSGVGRPADHGICRHGRRALARQARAPPATVRRTSPARTTRRRSPGCCPTRPTPPPAWPTVGTAPS